MVSRLNLSGQKFNMLSVKEKLEQKNQHGQYYYLCQCDCGNYTKVIGNKLTRKDSPTKSCGCIAGKSRIKDLTGQRKNQLEILHMLNHVKNGQRIWLAKCDCGNLTEVKSNSFTAGLKRSCGCLAKHNARKTEKSHGRRKTPEYISWLLMRKRCCNISCPDYVDYGGMGITICEEWENDFKRFYQDMGDKPHRDCTLDRIDLEKGYFKENCRWASPYIQARNRRGRRNTSSKYKSVQKEGEKWVAIFSLGSIKAKRIGVYENEDEAAAAVNLALNFVFGENCSYVFYNNTPFPESNVDIGTKFFNYWVPLLVEEREKLYKEYS